MKASYRNNDTLYAQQQKEELINVDIYDADTKTNNETTKETDPPEDEDPPNYDTISGWQNQR